MVSWQVWVAAVAAAALGCVALGAVALSTAAPRSELMMVRMPNGKVINAVPMRSLFGPGDLPRPIEDDGMPGGDQIVIPGSNVHLFEHMGPPQPYGMDNRRDPPYDTSFGGMGYGSDGR